MGDREQTSSFLTTLSIPDELAHDLVRYYYRIREELQRKDLEKSSVGKFVEILVQILQSLRSNVREYDRSPRGIDGALRKYETEKINKIPNDSRVAIVRIARAIYCLRSKRGIVHRNDINPNLYDLEFIHDCAKWILTELVRLATKNSMEEARKVIGDVQRPVYPVIEQIMGRRLVLEADVSTRDELLLVLYDDYSKGEAVSLDILYTALDRRTKGAVRSALRRLREGRFVEGKPDSGYLLTRKGVDEAIQIMRRISHTHRSNDG